MAPDEQTPVEVDVPGVSVAVDEDGATLQWPDFGPGGSYAVQVEAEDGTWQTQDVTVEDADVTAAEAAEVPAAAVPDHEATIALPDPTQEHRARIVSAPTQAQADAATEPAITSAGTPRGAAASVVRAADVAGDAAVSTEPIIITPFATATSTDIVINVRTMAQPLGISGSTGTNYANTVGATFQLYTYTTAAAGPQSPVPGATCTVSANGTCLINVTGTNAGGPNNNAQFWVVQTAAASGAYSNGELRLGSSSGPTTVWFVPGLTQPLQPNTIQTFPRVATESSLNGRSFGAAANSIVNPTIIPKCTAGLRMALVMDLSTSVTTAQRVAFRNAIVGPNGLFDVLQPTNSSIAVFTFGTNTPASGTSNFPQPLLLNAANRAELEARIDVTTTGTNYTNWDRALREVANQNAANDYDAVLFITDGAPNYIASTTGGGTGAVAVNDADVTLRSLEAATYSANAIKAQGVRIVGVGVGAGVAGDVGLNLRAISGQNENSDYFRTGSWDLLQEQLGNIAKAATCQVPIRVTKQVLSANGQSSSPDDGWTITTTPSAVTPGTAALNPTAGSQVTGSGTNATGQVNWSLVFSEPNGTATVTIAENANSKPGHAFVDGTCTVFDVGGTSTAHPMSSSSITLTGIAATDRIECTIRNQPNTATVVITKRTNEPTAVLFPFTKSANVPGTGTITGSGATNANGFTLGADATYTVTVPVLASGGTPYIFSEDEANLTPPWRLEGTPVCAAEPAAGAPGTSASLSTSGATVTVNSIDPLVTVRCTYTNTNVPVPETSWTAWKWSNPTSGSADSPAVVQPGSQITYELYASNKEGGNQPVSDLVLSDDLQALLPYVTLPDGFPDGIEIQDRSGDDGTGPIEPPVGDQIPPAEHGTVTYTGGVLTWSIPNLDPEKRLRLSFTVTVNDDAFGTTIVNSLTADSDDPETPPPNACAPGTPCETFHETPEPSWTVAKSSVPSSGEIALGATIVYTVTATNTGQVAIPNAVLTDDLSSVLGDGKATLGAIEWTTPTGTGTVLGPTPSYDAGSGLLTGTITSLAPGSSVSMQYSVELDRRAYGQVFRNAAWGDSPPTPPDECIETDPCETIHITPAAPRLTLEKQVVNSVGGQGTPADWTLTAGAPTDVPDAPGLGGPGSIGGAVWSGVRYLLDETPNASVAGRYTVATTWTCTDAATGETGGFDLQPDAQGPPSQSRIVLNAGADVTCTIVNRDLPAELTLVKTVTNDNGGTALPTEWTLTADGPTAGVSGPTGDAAVTEALVDAGDYDLSESGPDGYTAGDWSCTGGTLTGSTVTVDNGASVVCTINNDDQPATLTLIKTVTNDNGGTALPTEWTLTADGPTAGVSGAVGDVAVTDAVVDAGSYDLSESGGPAGYTPGAWSCTGGTLTGSTVVVPVGGSVECTIDNDDQPAALTLIKTVTNDNGGTALPTEWTLTADGPTAGVSGAVGDPAVTGAVVDAGSYDLSESGGPAGYTASSWTCTGGTLTGSTVVVPLGGSVECTINNDDQAAALTLTKTVTNDHGGTALTTDWTLSAQGPTPISGTTGAPAITSAPVDAGSYDLSETGGPAGYTAGAWDCGPATMSDADTVVVPLGGAVECVINNDDQPAQLTLVKEVDPAASGSTRQPSEWTLTATPQSIPGQGTVSGNGDPTDAGGVNAVEVFAGDYLLSESGPGGFDASEWVCQGGVLTGETVTVPNGGNVICTITNTAVSPTLTLVKVVDPGAAGAVTTPPTAWTLTATGPTPISGAVGDASVTNAQVAVGTYALTESDLPGWTASAWVCTGGTQADASITLAEGENATCTVTNTAIAPQLTLIKEVVGGMLPPTAWQLTADGPVSITGATGDAAVTAAGVQVGTYDLSETDRPGYLAGPWVCTGATSSTGASVTLDVGQHATCTITNTQARGSFTLQKVWVDGVSPDTAELSVTGAATGTATSFAPDAPASANRVVVQVGSQDTVELSELLSAPTHYQPDLSCDADGLTYTGGTTGSFTMPVVPPTQGVICTFTNTRIQNEVTLTKVWEDGYAGDTTTLRITGGVVDPAEAVSTANGQAGLWTDEDPAHVAATNALVGDTVTLSEALGADNVGEYSAAFVLECTASEGDPVALTGPTFTMPAADVHCLITNERVAQAPDEPTATGASCNVDDRTVIDPGTITITGSRDYGFFINGEPYAPGTYTFPPGTYTVTAELTRGTQGVAAVGVVQAFAQATYTWTVVVEDAPVCPDLTKDADPPAGTEVVTGQTIVYTVTVRNAGGEPVVGEEIVDTLPDGVELVAGSVQPAGAYDATAGTITWSVDLPAASGGVPAELILTYRVTVTAEEGTLVNTVTWTERDLTVTTEHPVTPEEPTPTPTPTPTPSEPDLPQTGAGNASDIAIAGLLLLGGGALVTLGVRRRRREE